MAKHITNSTIKDYFIKVSRVRKWWKGIIPTTQFVIRYDIVVVYDSSFYDDGGQNSQSDMTITYHNNHQVVDWYYEKEQADTNLLIWKTNIGVNRNFR
jgi:hypothetical protein